MALMKAYRTKEVTLVRHKGQDKYQEPLPTDSVTLYAFPKWENRNVTNFDGELVVSKAHIDLELLTVIDSGYSTRASGTISYRDRLTIDTRSYKIVSIEEPRDFRARFTRVYIA